MRIALQLIEIRVAAPNIIIIILFLHIGKTGTHIQIVTIQCMSRRV